MSVQKTSIEQFSGVFRNVIELDHRFDFAGQCHPESESAGQFEQSSVGSAPIAVRPNGDTSIEESERYFAKPGEAEWGC